MCVVIPTAKGRQPKMHLTKAVAKQISAEKNLEYATQVSNQHSSKARLGCGNKAKTKKELFTEVQVKTKQKAGEAYNLLRCTKRGRALWNRYCLGEKRLRGVLFTFQDLKDAALGKHAHCTYLTLLLFI